MIILKSKPRFLFKTLGDLVFEGDASNPLNNGTLPAQDDPISSLVDLSVVSGNAVQAAPAERPLFKHNVQNGRPGILFNGTTDSLSIVDTPSLDLTNGFTMFFVVNSTDKTAILAAKTDVVSTQAYQTATVVNGGSPRGLQLKSNDITLYTGVNLVPNTTVIYTYTVSASEANVYINRTNALNYGDDLRPDNVPSSNVMLGRSPAGFFLNGYLFHTLIFARSFTLPYLEKAWAQLNRQWAVY